MSYRYAVLGSGRQGTAAAFDMGRFGEAEVVWLLDSDLAQAERAARRVNGLLGGRLARAAEADASDPHSVAGWMRREKITAFISAVPYFFNLGLTHAAIEAGAGMTTWLLPPRSVMPAPLESRSSRTAARSPGWAPR